MNTLQFTKMHGLGNDFMVIDAIAQAVAQEHLPIPAWAHRYLGVGFDQLLLLKKSAEADFFCHIFNADGNEVEQCGNGLRCVARYVADKGLVKSPQFTIATHAGIFTAEVLAAGNVRINLGAPNFTPSAIPFLTPVQQTVYPITLEDQSILQMNVLSMGNPHAIITVPKLLDYPWPAMGEQITGHPAFTHGTNVGFIEIINREELRLATYERGVGPTHSCGSNACAAVVAGIMNGKLDNTVRVYLKYGELSITWTGGNNPVLLTGPAVLIFDGAIVY